MQEDYEKMIQQQNTCNRLTAELKEEINEREATIKILSGKLEDKTSTLEKVKIALAESKEVSRKTNTELQTTKG